MGHYLVDHALRHVWTSPIQDSHISVEPKRICAPQGALNNALIMEQNIELPVKKRYVHLFQFGQMDPKVLGLLRQVPYWRVGRWFKFSEAMLSSYMDITVHTANGVRYPCSDSYYMFTDEFALVFAVPEQQSFRETLNGKQLYFRFYSNMAFRRPDGVGGNIVCDSTTIKAVNDIINLENDHRRFQTLAGRLRVYVNGLLTEKAQLGDLKINDQVEWVFDPSIKHVVEWRLSELHQFHSDLDKRYKYLLHYPGTNTRMIDFQDDIDVHVIYKPQVGFTRGVYYNRLNEINHRMVTHRDYAILTDMVDILKEELGRQLGIVTPDAERIFVRIYIRDGYSRRPLIYDNNRIFELYKMNDQDRYRAMIGVDSTLDVWNCAKLESSGYTEIMRVPYLAVTPELVERAYGYNGAVKVLADSPIRPFQSLGNLKIFKLPYLLSQDSVVYEFDADGLLLGYHYHQNDDDYEARDPRCELIEAIPGTLSEVYDSVEGQDNLPLPDPRFSYRVYFKPIEYLHTDDPWADVTERTEFYRIENRTIKLNNPRGNEWLAVRSDKNVITYERKAKYNDGILNFSLLENPTGNPIDTLRPIRFPVGRYDIWMNRHRLIEWVDYIVNYPVVYVFNKTLLKQPIAEAEQDIVVRLYGLTENTINTSPVVERGWITHGALSNNRRFNLRDDKVLQINIGGKTFHREELLFEEPLWTPAIIDEMNGLPYEVKDLLIPLRGHLPSDTYDLRLKSRAIDQGVSDYLTKKVTDPKDQGMSAIVARYPMVSLFMSYITQLIITGRIELPDNRDLEHPEIVRTITPHEWTLDLDRKIFSGYDARFAYIIPHGNHMPYAVSPIAYRFLEKIAKLYVSGISPINEYYTIN